MGASGLAKASGLQEPTGRYFRLLLDAAPDAMVVAGHAGRILLVNVQTERLFGYAREELLGQPVEGLMPKRYRRRHAGHRAGYFRHPTVRSMGRDLELFGMRKDGSEFPVEISLSPIETGGETLVLSAIRDVTERKRVESQISHLAGIVSGSDDAIISSTLNGSIVSWNPGAEKVFGHKESAIVGRPISVLAGPQSRTEIPGILARLRRGESLEHYETTSVREDGRRITVSMTVSPVKSPAGAVVGVAAIVRDITEQRRIEAALRESEERFRVALKSSPTVVFNQDRRLRYTWINSPILAWAAREWIGHTDWELLGPEESEHLMAIKRKVLRSGVGTRTEATVTYQGETHYFDLTLEPLRDRKGACVGLTGAATDITQLKLGVLEQKRLNAELQEALDQVNLLSGLLSICASCKRIKDERGAWQPMESYIQSRSEATFTHGLCPDCLRTLYPQYRPK